MNHTPNLNLNKPETSDVVNVSDFNTNFDTIDSAYGAMNTAVNNAVSSAGKRIYLSSSDNTWSKIWAKISVLSSGEAATLYCHADAFTALSGETKASSMSGTITRASSTTFEIMCKYGASTMLGIRMSNVTSTDRGTYSEYDYYESIKSKSFADSASATVRTLSIPNGFRGIITGIGAAHARSFTINVLATGAGAINIQEVVKGSGVSFDTSAANRLKITTTSTGTITFFVQTTSKSALHDVEFVT